MHASPFDADGEGVRALLGAAVAGADSAPWSGAVGVVVELMLGARFPMFAAWGPELRLLHNDAGAAVLGERHPGASGQPLAQAFDASWAGVMPAIEASLAGETRPPGALGPALIGRLRRGQVLQLDDIAADPLGAPCVADYESIGARAMIVVPIIEAGRLAAIFYLHDPAPRAWTERELALADDVARQTREAVRRARVEESLRDETRILEVLNQTGQALASTLDAAMLLQAITDAGTQLSGARFGAFFYKAQDARGENLMLYTVSGAPRDAFERFGNPRPTAIFQPTFHNEGIVRSGEIRWRRSAARRPCSASSSATSRACARPAPSSRARSST